MLNAIVDLRVKIRLFNGAIVTLRSATLVNNREGPWRNVKVNRLVRPVKKGKKKERPTAGC